MKITFVGATHEVTGSCYFLEAAGNKFLVDCGMEQGPDNFENIPIPVPASELDFVLLTPVFCTPAWWTEKSILSKRVKRISR